MIKFISIDKEVKVEKVDELFPDEYVGPHYSHKVIDSISGIYLISKNELFGEKNDLVKEIVDDFPCYGTCLIVRYNHNDVDNPYETLDDEDICYFSNKLGVNIY